MNWFRRKKEEEISYKYLCPDEECPSLIIRAISSLKGEIAIGNCIWYSSEKRMHIGDLHVNKDFLDNGIGSYILKEIIRISTKLEAIEISGNISSVDDVERLYCFYSERGFSVTECKHKGNNTVATIKYEFM